MPVKLFIIKREKFSYKPHIEQINRGDYRASNFTTLQELSPIANRTDTVRLSPIYNACNKRRVLNAPASRIIIEQ